MEWSGLRWWMVARRSMTWAPRTLHEGRTRVRTGGHTWLWHEAHGIAQLLGGRRGRQGEGRGKKSGKPALAHARFMSGLVRRKRPRQRLRSMITIGGIGVRAAKARAAPLTDSAAFSEEVTKQVGAFNSCGGTLSEVDWQRMRRITHKHHAPLPPLL